MTIGYSFSDEYVNGLIGQSLMQNSFAKILTVFPTFGDGNEAIELRSMESRRVAGLLGVDENRVLLEDVTAEDFFETTSGLEFFEALDHQDGDSPFEVFLWLTRRNSNRGLSSDLEVVLNETKE